MQKQTVLRQMRRNDLVADFFEKEADRMPPSRKEEAESRRKLAQTLRNSSSTETVCFREETN